MYRLDIADAPAGASLSLDFRLQVNGRDVPVYHTATASFASLAFAGEIEVVVMVADPIRQAVVRPLSKQISPSIAGETLRLRLAEPANLSIEIAGRHPLFLFADAPETNVPDRLDPQVRFFERGKVHDAGCIELASGETLYIEAGAIVRGTVRAVDADGVRIAGRGILDGCASGGVRRPDDGRDWRTLILENCRDARVEDITMIEPLSWMLVLGACERVTVSNLRQIGIIVSSDGIDIVGSRDVTVERCFLFNNDDCIAIKAINYGHGGGQIKHDWRREVANVLVRDCTFLNGPAGNVIEIGFETQTNHIHHIIFRNIDVIGAHGGGGVFTIHAGDRALISDVLYEDIRVEHFWDKIVDFRIMHSIYSKDTERGRVRDVTFRHIRAIEDVHNTLSIIGGFDAEHGFENIVFEDFRLGERHILSEDALNLYTKHARGLVFR